MAARHTRAGHWGDRRKPMLTSGKVGYEVAGSGEATCFGGISAVHRLVTKLGLVEQINDELDLLKVHLPYHESDHVLNLAYNVLCGGTRLEDIERLRHDVAYMNALGAELIVTLDNPIAAALQAAGCRYQWARTLVLLGGAERVRG